ncbi:MULTISPECIES: protein-tyrosine phosphatase family protein [Synechococcales]|uniref:hypothetical protein n=1 Tax=Synechococcus sp. CS-1324 TaxID=2847980 RepID=UPI00223BC31A|nr:hypothetical protein [Synechococcus sp. CS-1324]
MQPGSEAAFLHGGVSLPDHRQQEPLSRERLLQAINASREMLDHSPPLYLHCLAGRERSVALAIAHVSMIRGLSVYEALLAVRAAHPPANPLFEHLELLEVLLKPEQPFSLATEPSLQSIQPPGAA